MKKTLYSILIFIIFFASVIDFSFAKNRTKMGYGNKYSYTRNMNLRKRKIRRNKINKNKPKTTYDFYKSKQSKPRKNTNKIR